MTKNARVRVKKALLRPDSAALAIVLNRIDSLMLTKPVAWRARVSFLRRVEARLRDGGAE